MQLNLKPVYAAFWRAASSLRRFVASAALLFSVLSASLWLIPSSYAQTTRPAPIIAVWQQPSNLAATWKARGVNTFIGVEAKSPGEVDSECAAVAAAGLKLVIQASDFPPTPVMVAAFQKHFGDANVVAIRYRPDEPNGSGESVPKSPGQVTDEIIALRAIAGGKPILINLDGWQMLWKSDATIAAYCAAADWVSADQYPCNRGEADPLSTIPKMLARLKKCAPGKRLFCCLETADQHTGAQDWSANPDASGTPPRPRMHPPSPLEVDAEARQADDAGAEYVWYSHFNDPLKGLWAGYDGTPAMVAAAIGQINARKMRREQWR